MSTHRSLRRLSPSRHASRRWNSTTATELKTRLIAASPAIEKSIVWSGDMGSYLQLIGRRRGFARMLRAVTRGPRASAVIASLLTI